MSYSFGVRTFYLWESEYSTHIGTESDPAPAHQLSRQKAPRADRDAKGGTSRDRRATDCYEYLDTGSISALLPPDCSTTLTLYDFAGNEKMLTPVGRSIGCT